MKKKELSLQIAELREDLANVKKHVFIKSCPDLKDVNTTNKELEVGKWYKRDTDEIGTFLFLEDKNEFHLTGYGFCEGDWVGRDVEEEYKGWCTMGWTLATPEEVKSALVEEAKRRGFEKWNDQNVKCTTGKIVIPSGQAEKQYFDFISEHNSLSLHGIEVFDKGKWAEIIEQPQSILDGKPKQKEIILEYPSIRLTIHKNGFDAKSKIDGRLFTFENEDIDAIIHAQKQLKGGENA